MASAEEIQAHYDVDNDFYALFLDADYRVYSCGVWDGVSSLEAAQAAKLRRLARFAGVKRGHRVLDIGCGWGGMLRFCGAEHDAGHTVGLTLSRAQLDFINQLDIPSTDVHLCSWQDYRTEQRFDSIVSIGAFEHFASLQDRRRGRQVEIYRQFFQTCRRLSTPRARVGLQTIVTIRNPDSLQSLSDARFLLTHIFQGSALPRVEEIQEAIAGIYEERESLMIGHHYARTLDQWQSRLERNRETTIARYGEPLYTRYREYFIAARRSFENGYISLRQMSLVPV